MPFFFLGYSPRHINAQAKHVLIIMEIGLGYFYVLLPPNTITKMVELASCEAENANTFSAAFTPPLSSSMCITKQGPFPLFSSLGSLKSNVPGEN